MQCFRFRLQDIINDFYYGTMPKKEDLSDCGFPVHSGYRVVGYSNKYNLEEETLIVVARGVGGTGDVKIIPAKTFLTNLSIALVHDKEKLNLRYAYYYLNQQGLRYLDTGAAQSQITINNLRKHIVYIPSILYQDKIAFVLSAYDDLIEKNNRKIQILQDMAEELYKEWFVRFRFPGHETAKFADGIPDGWEVKRMNDFCYVTDGTHDTPKPQFEGIPLVTGKCIDNGFIDFSLSYPISIEDHENIKVRSGLKSGDILFSNIGTVGTICMVDYTREFSVKNVIIFKPESKFEGNYLYYWLNSKAIQETFSNQTNGASQQFVGLTFMRRFKILVPTKEVLEQFSNKVDSIVQARRGLHNINENLKAQRDLLLPRLMSGKLEVKVKQEV